MNKLKQVGQISVSMSLLLLTAITPVWAVGIGSGFGGAGGVGLGGESRGLTSVEGRVVCARCDLQEMRVSQPDLIGLYELQHQEGQIVMQLNRPEEASDAAWWEAIAGLNHIVAVRTSDEVFTQLMAEENLHRHVAIQGMLRPTRTYDVVDVAFLEDVQPPLRLGQTEASDRAEAAAAYAESAAERAEQTADRLAEEARNAEARFEAQLRK